MIVKNQHLINTFKTLILQYQQELKDTKDKSINFKISTFRKAIKIIEALDFEIINGNQLKDYKGIGTKTMDKIDEIIKEGDLKRLKGFEANNSISWKRSYTRTNKSYSRNK